MSATIPTRLLVLGAALVLAACGSEAEGGDDPGQANSAPVTATSSAANGGSAVVAPISPCPTRGGAVLVKDDFCTPVTLTAQAGGLEVGDILPGSGPGARLGQKLSVQYTGWLADGKMFDSSRTRGQAFTFTLGKHEVIPGWDQGLQGVKAGGKRRLVIPPALGYGDQGAGADIPPGATLIFVVDLVKIG